MTAQELFKHVMRDLVAPTLHDLGFKGAGPRVFRYRSGDYGAAVATQKSTASNREQVRFWVHLFAAYLPTNSTYWTTPLHALIPGNTSFTSWTIRADAPAEPVVENLLSVFLDNGWPAIQAALDSPGYPPDPAASWARTFPSEPTADRPPQVEHTRPFRPSGRRNDHLLAELGHPDETARIGAAAEVGARALRHPQAIPALLDHLEHDPSPAVRQQAALALRTLASEPDVRQAFQAAAAQDEDLQVRWAARYAIRLATAEES